MKAILSLESFKNTRRNEKGLYYTQVKTTHSRYRITDLELYGLSQNYIFLFFAVFYKGVRGSFPHEEHQEMSGDTFAFYTQ